MPQIWWFCNDIAGSINLLTDLLKCLSLALDILWYNSLSVLLILQRRNHELAALLEQHSAMNSTLMNQIEDLVRTSCICLCTK